MGQTLLLEMPQSESPVILKKPSGDAAMLIVPPLRVSVLATLPLARLAPPAVKEAPAEMAAVAAAGEP